MNINSKYITFSKQTGATLFISLMLLIGISLISLAAMRSSLLELVIANNKQQYSNTFQAAEQVINQRFSNLNLAIQGTEPKDVPLAGYTIAGTVVTDGKAVDPITTAFVDSAIIYRGQGPSTGWDLDQFGLAYHFYINAEASAPGRGGVSRHRAGFYIVAPSAN